MKTLQEYIDEKLVINKHTRTVSYNSILDEIWSAREYDKSSKVDIDLKQTDAAHWLPVKLWEWVVGNIYWKDKDGKNKILSILKNVIVETYDSKFDVKAYTCTDSHIDKISNGLVGKCATYETSYSLITYYIDDDYSYIRYEGHYNSEEDWDLIIKKL